MLKEQYKFIYHAAATSLNWRRSQAMSMNDGQPAAPVVGASVYYNVGPHPSASASGADNSQWNIYVNTAVLGVGMSNQH